eukprot:1401588-Alexandrium_andersonii.AAC.1
MTDVLGKLRNARMECWFAPLRGALFLPQPHAFAGGPAPAKCAHPLAPKRGLAALIDADSVRNRPTTAASHE